MCIYRYVVWSCKHFIAEYVEPTRDSRGRWCGGMCTMTPRNTHTECYEWVCQPCADRSGDYGRLPPTKGASGGAAARGGRGGGPSKVLEGFPPGVVPRGPPPRPKGTPPKGAAPKK